MKLYQLYTTDSLSTYKEYATDYVTTIEKLDVLLDSQDFQNELCYYLERGITGCKIEEKDKRGVINLRLQYLDFFRDYGETIFCLVPLKSFV